MGTLGERLDAKEATSALTSEQVSDWLAQAEQQDEDLFAEVNLEEQERLYKMFE